MGFFDSIKRAVSRPIQQVVRSTKKIVTNPRKANFGDFVSFANPLGGTLVSDFRNPEDALIHAGIAGGAAFLPGLIGGAGAAPTIGLPSLGGLGKILSGVGGLEALKKIVSGGLPQLPAGEGVLLDQAQQTGGLDGLLGNRSLLENLALAGGLGLGAAGLFGGGTDVDLGGVFAGSQEEAQRLIAEREAVERARQLEAEQQFLASRGQARQTLEQTLGQGSDEAFRQAIQGRQEQLNRQGLLGGPSGALDAALAQEAGNLRRQTLPFLTSFDEGTQTGLQGLRGGALQGSLELGRAGLSRQFGLGDLTREASLKQRLLNAEREAERKRALIGAGSAAIGFGLGGLEGARTGAQAGRGIDDILNPQPRTRLLSGGL